MTPLVLLPGMMCDARLFAPQVAALSEGRAVQVLPITQHASMSELAAEALAQAPPTFALAGLSMGGIVAMEVLAQAPERIAGLALLDTSPLAEAQDRQDLRQVQIAEAEAGGLERIMREEMKPLYLADGPKRAGILDLCLEMAMSLGPDVFVRQSKALAGRVDQSQTLRDFKRPALVLCGREDKLCPVARHELMHDLIEGSTLRVIEGAGHLPVLEQPETTNAALAGWLSAVDDRIAR